MSIEKYGAFVGVTNDINAGDKLLGEITTGIDQGEGGRSMGGRNAMYAWLWSLSIVFVLGTAGLVFINRSRLFLAMQTNNGHVVTGGRITRRQIVAAVKDSTVSPSSDVLQSIMKKVGA